MAMLSLRHSMAWPSGSSRGTLAKASFVGATMVMLDAAASVSASPSTSPTSSSSVLRSSCDARRAAMSPWARQVPAISTEAHEERCMVREVGLGAR